MKPPPSSFKPCAAKVACFRAPNCKIFWAWASQPTGMVSLQVYNAEYVGQLIANTDQHYGNLSKVKKYRPSDS